jgi:type VI secretion system protein ImpL
MRPPPVPRAPRRPTVPRVTFVAGFLLFAVLVWFVGTWAGLTGGRLWALRIGLWLLGAAAAGVAFWFARTSGRRAGAGAFDEMEAALRTAGTRLAAVGPAGARGFSRRPVIVVLGPTASAKTTSVTQSGLDPDLVAGAAFQGDEIRPTSALNIWYVHDTVMVEAGGSLLASPGGWARLVRRLTPPRLAAALTGRPQAARAAVVCFPIEAFLQADAADAVPRAAKQLRGALVQLAQGMGVQLPVYVWFTKLDRLPHFAEFVAQGSREEVWEALGAAMRWPDRTSEGLYAEQQFVRVAGAFQQVTDALAARRLEWLARESDLARRGLAYEFTREMRKLETPVVQFLVELCRPRHLATSPVLRGFYFTGVRARYVQEDAAPPAVTRGPGARRATGVFGEDALSTSASAPTPTGRRVPEWAFLGRVFRDVVLRDGAAAAVARRGAGVGLVRRTLLASAAVVSLVLGLGFITSFINNRQLESDVLAAARAAPAAAVSDPGVPDAETLRRLDSLRQRLARLARYQSSGRPLRLAWGLYTGTSLAEAAGSLYRDRVERLLVTPARAALQRDLRSLPDTGSQTGDYGRGYDLLRAYLMITNRTDRLDTALLVPVLLNQWLDGRQLDAERTELTRAQFSFYAATYCRNGACSVEPDNALIARTRGLLRRYAGPDQVYQLMVARAAAAAEPVRFARDFPSAGTVVSDPYEVPAAFTREGWAAMEAALTRVDEVLQAEDWVMGEKAPLQVDRNSLVAHLRARYAADYVRHWTAYLTSAGLTEFAGLSDASRKLRQLSGNQSPLLQLFALASRNTAVDTVSVGPAFRAVQLVVPPGDTNTYIGDSNQEYMNALIGLGNLVEQAAGASPGEARALSDQTLQGARAARDAVRHLALTFPPQGDAGTVSGAVQRLMEAPVTRIEGMVGRLPSAAINSRGAAFCASFGQLASRYPFNPASAAEVSYDDLAGMFQPNTGALWGFYNDYLQGSLALRGSRYVAQVGAPLTLSDQFVRFFNRAAGMSRALWAAGDTARVDFVFKPRLSDAIPTVSLSVDGYTGRWTRTATAQRPFSWVGPRASDVQLTAQVRGRDVQLAHRGTWALFRLFQQAELRSEGPTAVLRWQLDQQGEAVTLEAEVVLAGTQVFDRGFFAGLSCVSRVAR